MKYILLVSCILISINVTCQSIQILDSGNKISCRGLSVLNDSTFWISGAKGTIGHSINAGATINWQQITGYENRDFRDIHAFNDREIIIMAIDNPAILLKTIDGGLNWHIVYEYNEQGMFLDAMDFKGDEGYCIGDPIHNHFFILHTKDRGEHWSPIENTPLADSGEACFASSGTNIQIIPNGCVFISGGVQSHLYLYNGNSFIKRKYNFSSGIPTSGANSIVVTKNKILVTGGDFNSPNLNTYNFFYSSNGGKSFTTYSMLGYKSCIEMLNPNAYVACGTSGVALSADMKIWKPISSLKFHTARKAMNGNVIYLVGGNGLVGRLAN